jgi:DNA-binding transcriptional ArsR family regulator
MLSEWGIDKSAKSRALAVLREAGYIDVIQSEGGSSRIRVQKARVSIAC